MRWAIASINILYPIRLNDHGWNILPSIHRYTAFVSRELQISEYGHCLECMARLPDLIGLYIDPYG